MLKGGVKIPGIEIGELHFEAPKKVEVFKQKEKKEIEKGVEVGFATENSENHPHNEDRFTAWPDMIAVYDGMGGSKKGEEGAIAAKKGFEHRLSQLPDQPTPEALAKALEKIVGEVSNEIYEATSLKDDGDGKRKGSKEMGSTVSLLKVWKGSRGEKKVVIANVGDSRVYRLRVGKLEQLTEDQGAPNEIINDPDTTKNLSESSKQKVKDVFNNFNDEADLKLLTKEEREIFDLMFKFRAAVSQALGEKSPKPNTYIYDSEPGDEYFAITDGVGDPLNNKRIEQSLKNDPDRSPAQKAKDLIAEVKKANDEGIKRKKFDDKTAVGLRFEDEVLELDPSLVEELDQPEEVEDADVVEISPAEAQVIDELNKARKTARPSKRPVPPAFPQAKKKAA
jgi:serine/threonine protein phosphatase PrpC